MARLLSRRLAAAQAVATVQAGGRSVSLATILGAEFAKLPSLLFGPDRFHPSAAGYARLASVLVPPVVAALGLGPEEEKPQPDQPETLVSLADAAVLASKTTGTGLEPPTHPAPGRRTRLAKLRLRGRSPQAEDAAPEQQESVESTTQAGSD